MGVKMAGRKGRSGRKRSISALVNKALEQVDQRIPELFNKLIEKGVQGDRECLIYLIDRRLGKPKQSTDVDLSGADILVKLAVPPYTDNPILLDKAPKQLKGGKLTITQHNPSSATQDILML